MSSGSSIYSRGGEDHTKPSAYFESHKHDEFEICDVRYYDINLSGIADDYFEPALAHRPGSSPPFFCRGL